MFGGAEAALDALPDFTARRGRPLMPPDASEIDAEFEHAAKVGARFIAPFEPGYPPALARTERPPPLLCVRAKSVDAIERPGVALVGSRNASAAGLSMAKSLAADLGRAGYSCISGLARGVDAAAHLGSLETGTLAFLAGGIAEPYPPENVGLAEKIVEEGGALFSEMPVTWTARSQDFPKRNRLVAGSCTALIVIEAAKRSGSLITARQALDLNRTVMAVPGNPLDPRSDGPNALIRDGAALIRNIEDVLTELGPAEPSREPSLPFGASRADPPAGLEEPSPAAAPTLDLTVEAEASLAGLLSPSPIAVDVLVQTSGLAAGPVRAWLVEQELLGTVIRYPGDRFASSAAYQAS
ncbi:MAG: DNA-processing protein DprA [Devosiaceae bacterium]|nr:DNA-processing protein DprA [Devosiaceae bacterium MH13]